MSVASKPKYAVISAKIDALLDGKSPVGKLEAFSSTRKQLPADATMLMLTDAGPFAMVMGDYLLGIFKAMPIVPFNLPESMKPVQTVPAFFGTSIVMQPEYGSFDFFLPVTAVHEVRKVLMPLFTGEQCGLVAEVARLPSLAPNGTLASSATSRVARSN